MSKVSKFAKEVLGRIKGDEAGVLAGKIERKAKNALSSQIAALNSRKVDLETKVEDAEQALENAKYPGVAITSSERYIQDLADAQLTLDEATEELDEIDESIEFYQGILNEASEETAA